MSSEPIINSSTSREDAMRAFQVDGNLIRKTPQFQGDRALALIAIAHPSSCFTHPYEYLSSELKRDISIACVAATANHCLIQDFPRKVKASREVWAIRLKLQFIDCRYLKRTPILADDNELFVIAAQGYLDHEREHPNSYRYGSQEVINCFSPRIRGYFNSGPVGKRYVEAINRCKQNIEIEREQKALEVEVPQPKKLQAGRSMKL